MATSFQLWASILMMTASGGLVVASEMPDNLVDPTRPLGDLSTSHIAPSDLVVTSVMITEKRRVAVINGEQVSEGQEIGGAKVVGIQPGKVILLRAGRSEELKVHQHAVKHLTDHRSTNKSRL